MSFVNKADYNPNFPFMTVEAAAAERDMIENDPYDRPVPRGPIFPVAPGDSTLNIDGYIVRDLQPLWGEDTRGLAASAHDYSNELDGMGNDSNQSGVGVANRDVAMDMLGLPSYPFAASQDQGHAVPAPGMDSLEGLDDRRRMVYPQFNDSMWPIDPANREFEPFEPPYPSGNDALKPGEE